jgi:hypothetical protein
VNFFAKILTLPKKRLPNVSEYTHATKGCEKIAEERKVPKVTFCEMIRGSLKKPATLKLKHYYNQLRD